jgi:hypothetical protein
MKKKPFNVFPSRGYKNSQFKILSDVQNLTIKLFKNEIPVKSISVSVDIIDTIFTIKEAGIYHAICQYNNDEFVQEIEVEDSIRLGTSVFKKAFLFDNTRFSFFLLKDRLIIYDEVKQLLLTENHFSPTEIQQFDKSNFLFTTEVGNSIEGIINFGLYNTDSFSIIGELLNDYLPITVNIKNNKIWLFRKSSSTISCFDIIGPSGSTFNECAFFENASQYSYNSKAERIFIKNDNSFLIIDTKNLHNRVKFKKESKSALDKYGNQLVLDGDELTCFNSIENYTISCHVEEKINLDPSNYLFVGEDLIELGFSNLSEKCLEIKIRKENSIPSNKKYYLHSFSDEEFETEIIFNHRIFPTKRGILFLIKKTERTFKGVTFSKPQNDWEVIPQISDSNTFTIDLFQKSNKQNIIEEVRDLKFLDFRKSILIVKTEKEKFVLNGQDKYSFSITTDLELCSFQNNDYLFIKKDNLYSLYSMDNLGFAILKEVIFYNEDYKNKHKAIWYSVGEKGSIQIFDLLLCSHLKFDLAKASHSSYKNASDYKFSDNYILSSNEVIINPRNADIKDACVGKIESNSESLNKIVSSRLNHIYISVFNKKSKKYEEFEIILSDNQTNYKESYFSPNGQFLMLQNNLNEYMWYDLDKNESSKFDLGKFLSFSKDGNLIVEENSTKSVRIIDPLTFDDITPPNYHHYRFVSPDGKLYAQVASKTRYLSKLNGNALSVTEVNKLRRDLDSPSILLSIDENKKSEYQEKLNEIEKNRKQFFSYNKVAFEERSITDYKKVTSHSVIKIEKYTEIGIVGTSVKCEILFPEDLAYYNYSAFSYDSKFFGYVGKPSSKGLIHLFRIDFNEKEENLKIIDSFISRHPRYASWVCGFSKSGYFATYDSTPDTYLIRTDDQLFTNNINDLELQKNLYQSKNNIYYSYKKWNEIKGKSFLCFSPSGNYLALSEQGYEPLTLGGYGHQESNTVHIATTEIGQIINSFIGHGDKIKEDKSKKITFVAFSENEKKIMTLSNDGVVFIRNIDFT